MATLARDFSQTCWKEGTSIGVETTYGSLRIEVTNHELAMSLPHEEEFVLASTEAGLDAVKEVAARKIGYRATPGRDDELRSLCWEALVDRAQQTGQGTLVRAVARRAAPLVMLAKPVLDDPYIYSDMKRYRSCRVALEVLAEQSATAHLPHEVEELAQRMRDWRHLFALGGTRRKVVNRMIKRFDQEAPPEHWRHLFRICLQRTPSTLLHFGVLAELAAFRTVHRNLPDFDAKVALIEGAPDEALQAAAARLWQVAPEALEAVGAAHAIVEEFAQRQLPLRGASWRHLLLPPALEEGGQRARRVEPAGTPLKAPPIPVPTDPRFRWLRTAGALAEEGSRMRNCVQLRVAKAMRGASFIFHYAGEQGEATIEVNGHGAVVESKGPQNLDTDASEYAEAFLKRWGLGFWVNNVGGLEAELWHGSFDVPAGCEPMRRGEDAYTAFLRLMDAGLSVDRLGPWIEAWTNVALDGHAYLCWLEDRSAPRLEVYGNDGQRLSTSDEILFGSDQAESALMTARSMLSGEPAEHELPSTEFLPLPPDLD